MEWETNDFIPPIKGTKTKTGTSEAASERTTNNRKVERDLMLQLDASIKDIQKEVSNIIMDRTS